MIFFSYSLLNAFAVHGVIVQCPSAQVNVSMVLSWWVIDNGQSIEDGGTLISATHRVSMDTCVGVHPWKKRIFFFNFHTSITESFFAWIIQLNWNSLHRSAVHRAPDTPLISNAQYIRAFLQITHYSESDQQQICCGTRPSRAPRMDATQVTRSRWRHDAATTTTTKKGTQPVESNSVERLWLNQFPVDAGAPLYRLANDDRVALVAQLFSSPTDHHHLCMQPIIATNGLKECEHGERWSIVTNNYHLHYNRSGRGCSLFLYFFSLNSSVFYLHSMALCERIIATRVVRALSSIRIAFGIDAYIVCMR